jgi:hypothetical protein
MADAAIFIGWGDVIPGREQKALEVFGEALQYYGRLQQEGQIESFEPVFIGPHGGDLNGFILMKGDRRKLAGVRFSDEFERLSARAALVLSRFGIVPAYTGDELGKQMGLYQQQIGELA